MSSVLVTVILIAIFLYHSIVIEKNYRNPLSIFLGLYAMITFLGGLKLYGMRNFNPNVYWIVMIGVLAFMMGYYIFRFNKFRFSLHRSNKLVSYVLNEKLLHWTTILLCGFYLLIATRAMSSMLFRGLSSADIRMIYANGSEEEKIAYIYGSSFIKTNELMFVRPVYFSVIVLSIVRFFRERKADTQIKFAILLVILYTMIDFSRMVLIVLMVQILVCGLQMSKIKGDSIKRIVKKYILPVLIVLCGVLYCLSIMRMTDHTEGHSFLESLYTYFAIPMPLLSRQIEEIHSHGIYTYGVTFIKGFLNFIMTFLERVGISFPLYNIATEMVNSTQEFVYVFRDKTANAFTTMFMYFYLDFGMLGVVIDSCIFGSVIGQNYSRLIHNKDSHISELRMALYLLLMQALVKSIVRWEFVLMSFAMSFLAVRLFFRKKYSM